MNKYPRLQDAPYVVVDTETTGLDWKRDKVFGVSIALPEGPDGLTFYYDMRDDNDRNFLIHELPRARKFVNHNIKFDVHMLRESGVHIDPWACRCTMVAAALIDEHEPSYSLDNLAKKHVGIAKVDIWDELAAMFGGKPTRKDQIVNLPRAPRELVKQYAVGDVVAALRLYRHQMKEVQRKDSLGGDLVEVYKLEHELLPVLIDMERHGVRVDEDAARSAADSFEIELKRHQRELDKLAGKPVNANSPPQVKALLLAEERGPNGEYFAIDGTRLEVTEHGNPSVGAEALRRMAHPIAKLVLEIRSLDKTINTFLRGHILSYSRHGRVHCNYNQTKSDNDKGTGTGRLSVNSPALQQIHKRDKKMAQRVRACFLPDEGQQWVSYDWSQMDFRIFAHFAKAPKILAMYEKNPDTDFHAAVAELASIPRDRTPGTGGGNAKQINLGLVFGMQPGRMAMEMGLPYTVELTRNGRKWLRPGSEAEELFMRYHNAIPGVAEMLEAASAMASGHGYVRTAAPIRRRIHFPGRQFTHKAAGLIFQGTAADCLKHKLVEIHKILRGTDAKLLLNVHDEFDLSMPSDFEVAKPIMAEVLNELERFRAGDFIPLRVPIRAGMGRGPDWWLASSKDDAKGMSALRRAGNRSMVHG